MYSIEGRSQGLAPFLYNRMVDPTVLASGVSGGGPVGLQARQAEAEKKVYVGTDGMLCLPAWTFKRVLLKGAQISKIKINKTLLTDLVAALVFCDGDPSFGVQTRDFIHEAVGKIPPRTGAAAIIRRPALNTGWNLTFKLNVLEDTLIHENLLAALSLAGTRAGMGSWRPEYGRFLVVEWNPLLTEKPSRSVQTKQKQAVTKAAKS